MNAITKTHVLEFRISELKSVLNQLSLSATGRKAELQSRIFQFFGEPFKGGPPSTSPAKEEWRIQAANAIVEEVYRQWKGLPAVPGNRGEVPDGGRVAEGVGTNSNRVAAGHTPVGRNPTAARDPGGGGSSRGSLQNQERASASGAATLATGGQVETITAGENMRGAAHGDGVNGRLANLPPPPPRYPVAEIRCVCGSHVERGTMVQCEASGCGVWQHCDCVGVSKESMPDHFYCEHCRAAWADPFWEVMPNSQIMPSARLMPSGGAPVRGPGGVYEMEQVCERHFSLTHPQIDLLKRPDHYQLQVVSLVLGDPVTFRFQWPRSAELRINTMTYRVYSRQASSKVGNNLRDEPANMAQTVFPGRNKVRLKANDSRKVALLIQLVRRRDVEGVKALMAPPETLQAALQRVQQQVGGDEELSMGASIISLRDPISGSRVETPARFLGTNGLVAFDLNTFLNMAQRSRKWQCPHSMRHSRVQELQIDAYVTHILKSLEDLPEVMEVEVSADGEWRPKDGGYAWTQIADPLAPPLPTSEVKPEPNNDDDLFESDEELSEGEELRRAAKAYAAVAKRPAPDVIVLDDSSDEEEQRRAKRRAVSPERPTYPPRPLYQQTLQGSMGAFASQQAFQRSRQANGNGNAPGSGAAGVFRHAGEGSSAGGPSSSGSSGKTQPYYNGMTSGSPRSAQLSSPPGMRIHLKPLGGGKGSHPSRMGAASQQAVTSSQPQQQHRGIPASQAGQDRAHGGAYSPTGHRSQPLPSTSYVPASSGALGAWGYPQHTNYSGVQQPPQSQAADSAEGVRWPSNPPLPPPTVQAGHSLDSGLPASFLPPPPNPSGAPAASASEEYPGLVPMLTSYLDRRGEIGSLQHRMSQQMQNNSEVIDLDSD